MFPNAIKVLQLFLLTSISAASAKQSYSSLRQDRFNPLIILYEQKYIKLDIEEIINTFAKKHPRKMFLLNTLS